jgi:Txe/YoeB family toxin of Txe-Axe toxin-antitoxin module
MEQSNSIQSLVESIDDDHVFKLTEMTKKRVEHNNPAAQKRQRVVSSATNDPFTGIESVVQRNRDFNHVY